MDVHFLEAGRHHVGAEMVLHVAGLSRHLGVVGLARLLSDLRRGVQVATHGIGTAIPLLVIRQLLVAHHVRAKLFEIVAQVFVLAVGRLEAHGSLGVLLVTSPRSFAPGRLCVLRLAFLDVVQWCLVPRAGAVVEVHDLVQVFDAARARECSESLLRPSPILALPLLL